MPPADISPSNHIKMLIRTVGEMPNSIQSVGRSIQHFLMYFKIDSLIVQEIIHRKENLIDPI